MFHVLPIKVIIELPLVFRQTSFSNCGFARGTYIINFTFRFIYVTIVTGLEFVLEFFL